MAGTTRRQAFCQLLGAAFEVEQPADPQEGARHQQPGPSASVSLALPPPAGVQLFGFKPSCSLTKSRLVNSALIRRKGGFSDS